MHDSSFYTKHTTWRNLIRLRISQMCSHADTIQKPYFLGNRYTFTKKKSPFMLPLWNLGDFHRGFFFFQWYSCTKEWKITPTRKQASNGCIRDPDVLTVFWKPNGVISSCGSWWHSCCCLALKTLSWFTVVYIESKGLCVALLPPLFSSYHPALTGYCCRTATYKGSLLHLNHWAVYSYCLLFPSFSSSLHPRGTANFLVQSYLWCS